MLDSFAPFRTSWRAHMTTSMSRCWSSEKWSLCSYIDVNQLPSCPIYLIQCMLRDWTFTKVIWIPPWISLTNCHIPFIWCPKLNGPSKIKKTFFTARPYFACWAPSHDGGYNTFKPIDNTLKHKSVLLEWQRWKCRNFGNILLTVRILSYKDVPILKDSEVVLKNMIRLEGRG